MKLYEWNPEYMSRTKEKIQYIAKCIYDIAVVIKWQ